MPRTFRASTLVAIGLALGACVTINVYFPAAAVKELSRQIEEEVKKKAAEAPGGTSAPAPAPGQGTAPGSASLFEGLFGITPAYAQGEVAPPEISSPAIRKIIDSRAQRVAALNAYRAQGVIGENNKALLEIRNLEALTDLKARAEVQRLVRDENADREALFREIAAAKNVELSQLPKIRETYASTLRETARPGDWIQEPDGTWKQK